MGEDLFGKALMDFYKGRRGVLKMERDDGYIDEQDLAFYFENFDNFPDVERKALKHATGRVLDIGVGAGRVALFLQNKGHDVVGIDVSGNALRLCRLRGVKNVVNMSACDLKFDDGSFDTAIAFFNNFGLCGNMERVQEMLERLHDIVNDDGVFLAESIHPTNTKKRVHLRYHKMNIARGRPPGQVTLRTVYRGKTGNWWNLLMVTPEEMRTLCSDSGWRIERTYRDPTYCCAYVLRKA